MALHELAGITGISWVTVRKYILILEKKNFVVKRVENKQANWQINYERLT